MKKSISKLAIFALVLWVLTVGVIGTLFIKGWTTPSTDNRKAVRLSPSERDIVLGEMRLLLKAVNGVFRGLGQNDQTFIVKAIEPVGIAMAADINPMLMGKLPMEFKQLGMSVHKDFDDLNADIKKGIGNEIIIKRMGDITSKCIACHEAYQLSL
ncbi:MAG: hypothetical protein EHM20_08385 [Alphaproteobacteria bacterium]|nr:MAG: hypothetical protein EHM20_08385 [Alphaproteobacteria bacterium]